MIHSFDTNHAEKYGVGEAILIQNMIFWIEKNRANRKHFYDGRTWTYNSVQAFSELFPYYTTNQIRRILERLVAVGVLVKGFYSESLSDRTMWYAFNDESEFLTNAFGKKDKSDLAELPSHSANLPNDYNEQILNTDNKPDNKKEGIKPPRNQFVKPTIDEVREFMLTEGARGEADLFFNHYESVGWTIGKREKPMKDWKASARGWILRSGKYGTIKETREEMIARRLKELDQ